MIGKASLVLQLERERKKRMADNADNMTEQLYQDGKKRILFLTGTRADFGKLKPLMRAVENSEKLTCEVFVTGMHELKLYGMTKVEVLKEGFSHVHSFINQFVGEPMEMVLANTIAGLSRYVHEHKPDMIVIHGDRVEALAGAIVGALQNILVAHIEGGERSGTVDELLRHSASKLSHLHFVANKEAEMRLLQMGESARNVFTIGSPDIDIMLSDNLPSLDKVRERYNIPFENYAVAMFHPVTTEIEHIGAYAGQLVDAMLESQHNYVVIYPNNDEGTLHILDAYKRLEKNPRFRIFPSVRFEYFLTLMKKARFVVGNSSAGIREAPFYGVPTINIGTRQNNRFRSECILDCDYGMQDILKAIARAIACVDLPRSEHFGSGNSAVRFLEVLENPHTWQTSPQKQFYDLEPHVLHIAGKAHG